MPRRRLADVWLAFLVASLLIAACSPQGPAGSPAPTPGAPAADVGFSPPSTTACQDLPAQTPLAEVKGSKLWALVFGPLPIKANAQTKIVWRMGGRGAFNIEAKTTNGATAQLTFGPEPHGSSSWYIPNTDEWGTGFIFPTAGCWRVHAWRESIAGDVYFRVVAG